jgi:hypothetical protein
MRIAIALPTEIASFVSRGQAGRFFARNVPGMDSRRRLARKQRHMLVIEVQEDLCGVLWPVRSGMWVRFRAAMLMQ